ncbi:hypothetical protein BABINDRAFT_160991 [Babjeviella inositovora NRRL Y-12698]|uniref:Major facilitator superfamily (MFS) profile domain-containing protein n=1 Tax=Babjeviella inositovora NRRL Y-12698 TaxID=984486 RepID=A0A1E3QSV8_9ASCO|nr:uncharacterized protein BABINDRAFT_160991 [Babjeviella inositovora NRRL Y-12698]ODQ80779.1 hypothetical protein BABINDRAFT_160991 [Babjeviella inositovora NRRL Y-12698]
MLAEIDSPDTEPSEVFTDTDSTMNIESLESLINPVRSLGYLLLLTVTIGGLQLAWCTEFSSGTPFLLSLGVSKHTLALIWIAGPLSGTLGQPMAGILSDNCTYHGGRRKPFIWAGCIATTFSLWYLSHSTEIVGWFLRSTDESYIKSKTIPFAAFGIYLLDFSISCIQAAVRAFIVDNVPTSQQQIANAWAARMIGAFNIFGYFLGSIKLTEVLPSFLGNNQFKVLSSCAALTLIVTTVASTSYIQERNPRTDALIKQEHRKQRKVMQTMGLNPDKLTFTSTVELFFKQTLSSIMRLPPQVAMINWVEFCAWVGYFPMLFYTTTYVGDLYTHEVLAGRPLSDLLPDERTALAEGATRRGSVALLWQAIITLAIDLLLPVLIKPHGGRKEPVADGILARTQEYLDRVSVRNIWLASHVVFVLCMVSTFLIDSSTKAIVMVGFLGIPWGTALWAPFVLISEEIGRIKEIKARAALSPELHANVRMDDFGETPLLHTISDSLQLPSLGYKVLAERYSHYVCEPGIVLGVHNMFVALPQMISSLVSSLLFKMLSSGSATESSDSVGWVFRFGGVVTIGAIMFNLKVRGWDELQEDDERYVKEHGDIQLG